MQTLTLDQADRPLDPRAASEYLAAAGFPFQESTLCKLRCIGGGPRYLKNGSRVFYRPSALTEWLQSRTRELAHTSEAVAA
jgi:hypothetical protein